jgi:hypothetical protein
MEETRETEETTETNGDEFVREICDAFRFLGDASYAILPKDIAHNLGDLKKSFLSTVRSLIDKDIEWVDARMAGGDRLREEWKEKWGRDKSADEAEPAS